MTILPNITAAAAHGRRIMPIRGSGPSIDLSVSTRRLSLLLLGSRDASGPSPVQRRTARSAATIGTGTGHAARSQVAHLNGRITVAPGPGCVGDAEPMARRAENRLKASELRVLLGLLSPEHFSAARFVSWRPTASSRSTGSIVDVVGVQCTDAHER